MRQAVMRSPSFTGFGNRPVLIPAHQVDLLTGIGPLGASMSARRSRPCSGRFFEIRIVRHRLMEGDDVLWRPGNLVAELAQRLAELGLQLSFRLSLETRPRP